MSDETVAVRIWVAKNPDGKHVDIECVSTRDHVRSTHTNLKGRPLAVVDLRFRDGAWAVELTQRDEG